MNHQLLVGQNSIIDMKTGKFEHLETRNDIASHWDELLFYNGMSKMVWRNRLVGSFLKRIESIIIEAISSIKHIETYWRP